MKIKTLAKLQEICTTPALQDFIDNCPYEVIEVSIEPEKEGSFETKWLFGYSKDRKRRFGQGIPVYNSDYDKI